MKKNTVEKIIICGIVILAVTWKNIAGMALGGQTNIWGQRIPHSDKRTSLFDLILPRF